MADFEHMRQAGWGRFGDEAPCEHLLALRDFLEAQGLGVWSEHGEEPQGWVNVSCEACRRTYQTVLLGADPDREYEG